MHRPSRPEPTHCRWPNCAGTPNAPRGEAGLTGWRSARFSLPDEVRGFLTVRAIFGVAAATVDPSRAPAPGWRRHRKRRFAADEEYGASKSASDSTSANFFGRHVEMVSGRFRPAPESWRVEQHLGHDEAGLSRRLIARGRLRHRRRNRSSRPARGGPCPARWKLLSSDSNTASRRRPAALPSAGRNSPCGHQRRRHGAHLRITQVWPSRLRARERPHSASQDLNLIWLIITPHRLDTSRPDYTLHSG